MTRVGGYVLDKALLLLGMALDEALRGNDERAMYLLTSAFLALHGKDPRRIERRKLGRNVINVIHDSKTTHHH